MSRDYGLKVGDRAQFQRLRGLAPGLSEATGTICIGYMEGQDSLCIEVDDPAVRPVSSQSLGPNGRAIFTVSEYLVKIGLTEEQILQEYSID